MTRRLVFLGLIGLAGGPLVLIGAPLLLAGCTFTAYERELVVAPPANDESALRLSSTESAMAEESWMQFLDFNHIVDSIVELFKHTTAKEAIRNGVHYTERKRFLHFETGNAKDSACDEADDNAQRTDAAPVNGDE